LNLRLSLFIGLLLICSTAFGATIDELNYLGYPAGLNDGHYYVGNARGSLDSSPTNMFSMWCIDSLHTISQNSWDVKVMSITEAAASNSMNFTLSDFQLMAVSGFQFANFNPNDTVQQHIIWAQGDGRTLTAGEQAQRTINTSMLGSYDYSHITVFDPIESGGQMMMTGTLVPSQVPEPATYALFGGGLIILGGIRKFRARSRN